MTTQSQPTQCQPTRLLETLGSQFYDPVAPAHFPAHVLRYANQRWAERIGLGGLDAAQWIAHFGRFTPLAGSLAQPLALRYHGHQFRVYNPDLGDGRGFVFAQLFDLQDGRLLDLGTKGSGTTPYSRAGDGRLTLKGGVREVLATLMLEALGVSTSKTFSLIETGEQLTRADEPSPTRSSVLVRLSHSHIRYGTFQRLAYHQLADAMASLVDYCLRHLFGQSAPPALLADRVALLMDFAVTRASSLAASYMAAGFVHGVLNTDNINITGESFDYGPYRFAPDYDLRLTAAYFDHGGLYCYGRQAEALHWNVYQLARSLLTIAPQEALIPALESYPRRLEEALSLAALRRLGLAPKDPTSNHIFYQTLQSVLETPLETSREKSRETPLAGTRLSLDRFYFDWFGGSASLPRIERSPAKNSYSAEQFAPLRAALLAFKPTQAATHALAHAYFSDPAPQSLIIDEIEALWDKIATNDDWSDFDAKCTALERMRQAYAGVF
jgi:serine/tyrosine/threonine adenylyltransferase